MIRLQQINKGFLLHKFYWNQQYFSYITVVSFIAGGRCRTERKLPTCQWLATGRWFSPCPPVASSNKTDRHDIIEILLKVALAINQPTEIQLTSKTITDKGNPLDNTWSPCHTQFKLKQHIKIRRKIKVVYTFHNMETFWIWETFPKKKSLIFFIDSLLTPMHFSCIYLKNHKR